MKRKCISCDLHKDLEDFPKATTPSYSQQRYISKCKFCTNLYTHDITYSKYLEIATKQNHQCSLCERNLSDVKINIDHDHTTGQVRGILCKGCNISLGTIEKSLDSVKSQLEFIERQRSRLLKAAEYLANPPNKK